MRSAVDWLESLSPWPEEFGLERMQRLLVDLGEPQTRYPSIHVVGTKGKSTATRTIAELLRAEGLHVGAYTSPHVSGWHERLDTDPATLVRALERVRPHAEGATQFEVLTAAALAEFAAQAVDAAVVEAGLGGRLDATNTIDARVVHLTNVGLEHTDVLGSTREAIAGEKLAVAGPDAIVVLGEPEWEPLVPQNEVRVGGARQAAEAFLGRPTQHEVDVRLPGRFERRGNELWDGAHTPAAASWLVGQLERDDYVLCISILDDKDAEGILERLRGAGGVLVATESSNSRSLAAKELAARAEPYFEHVESIADPVAALGRARELAGPAGTVLVSGSLYLLADLSAGG